jgi:hypothetical protein
LLREGYVFLRQLDHRLRLERARSIDVLEWGGEKLEEIARAPLFGSDHAVGMKNGGRRLLRNYERQRDRIRSCYRRFFPSAE